MGNEKSEDDEDWEYDWEGKGKSGNVQQHKPNLNPQGQSNKYMNYQSIDKLFNKYSDKINVDQYECSDLKDLNLPDGERYVINFLNQI